MHLAQLKDSGTETLWTLEDQYSKGLTYGQQEIGC